MSEDTKERHQQANKEKLTRLLNARKVKDFLESRLRREVGTSEVAACMVLVERQDTQTRQEIAQEILKDFLAVSTAQEVDFPPKLIAFTMLYEHWQALKQKWGVK